MADDPNATTTIDPVTPPADGAAPAASGATSAPPSTPPARTFTQEELNRYVGEAREQGRRSATNAAPAARPAEQRPATEASRLDALEARYALQRAANLEGVRLTDEQEADMLTLYTVQRPEQPGEWFGRKVAAFNLKPAAPPPHVNTGAPAFVAPPVPPAAASTTAPGAPAIASQGALIDVSRLSRDQVNAMTPAALAAAVGAVLQAGQGSDGRPQIPAALRRK